MSLPSFPKMPMPTELMTLPSSGAGDHLPIWLLACCGTFTAIATGVSVTSIILQLKNYRKPPLQRAVVRIMVMVPLYAISSLIAIFSLEAAFFIDAVRDLYEAFVIYVFLQLLITYLGGERSLLIILHGRPPIPHPFPFNWFLSPMDVSDPWTLLKLKRGVLQYVQIKPILVLVTVISKATGTYREGKFAVDSGYTYVSIVYNTSICLSLYCLAMFWVCVNSDLQPFRPVPKFLCVKGILFFSFWQSVGISFLVAVHAIKKVGPYTDAEHMSLALVDSLICFEMPLFAIAHQYAFRASDYIDDSLIHVARLPVMYALRDAFGYKDVWEDIKDTFKGRGVSYQAYEPAEGSLHYGAGRMKRMRAGLRYAKGGQAKYWVPMPGNEIRSRGDPGPIAAIKRKVDERLAYREGYAPLLPKQVNEVVHRDPAIPHHHNNGLFGSDCDSDSDAASLDFSDVDSEEEGLYDRARRIGYAGFPNVDVSKEAKKRRQWEEEEGILNGTRTRSGSAVQPNGRRDRSKSAGGGKGKGKDRESNVYGAWADRTPEASRHLSSEDARRLKPARSPTRADADDAPYDGDIERPGAWRADSNDAADAQMRFTSKKPPHPSDASAKPDSKKNGHRPDSKPNTHGAKRPDLHSRRSRSNRSQINNAFAVGEESDPDLDEPVSPAKSDKPLPPDAVDLIVEDNDAREEAKTHERRKGEPQTNAPAHIYVAARNRSDVKVPSVQEVYDDEIQDERIQSSAFEPGSSPIHKPLDRMEEIQERAAGTGNNTPAATASSRAGMSSLCNDTDNPWA